jgi:hypothetical protein
MLKEILAVSGKSGLYRLVSKGKNLLIIESLAEKKRIPAYTRDKVISLGDISIYTDEDETPIREVFTAIMEKEGGGKVSLDLTKAGTNDLRAYLESVLPDFDRDRVYPSDIKKMLKWYDLLIADGFTDFSEKTEEEDTTDGHKEADDPEKKDKEVKKASKHKGVATEKAASAKRKETGLLSVQSAKASKAKPTPKTSAPKKSVVGAKRGS